MLNKKIKHKNNLLVFITRILFGLLLFNEKNFLLKKTTQKYLFFPHYLDRLIELLTLYPLSLREFRDIVYKFGFPTSEVYKYKFDENFTQTGKSDLFDSYKRLDAVYTTRLMLAYNRVDFFADYVDILKERNITTVLDYGCGVSDIGILLAKKGCFVSLVDLDLPKLSFTKKRFGLRGLPVTVYQCQDTESLVEISSKFDLIIATEIIEHFRYPIKMIDYFHDHLNNNGLLYLSLGKTFERESGGDHLDEAFHEGKSQEYWKNFRSKFKPIDNSYLIFEKK
ncbi:MAG: class I SAM-dependent methyltransferase [Candidatus Pacebacteria bacterium]|nr:class I SAM-dependent methyltransferase [Candidatus Paceibacterota bacterium]